MRTASIRQTPALAWLLVLGFSAHSARGAQPAAQPAAEITEQGWLVWSAPPECPTSKVIEAQVRGWVSGDVPPNDELRVRAAVTASGDGWTVHIIVHDGDVQGERHVATATCADAAQLVAIAAALAIAPDGSSIPGDDRHPLGTVQEEAVEAAPDAGSQTVSEPEPSAEQPIDKAKRKIPWSIGLGALLGTGLLPGVRGGLALDGGIRLGRLGVSLSALWFPAAATEVASGAPQVDLAALGGGASFAYFWGGPRLAFGPSLGGETGALIADQQGNGAARSPTAAPWLALLVGGRVRVPLHKSVRAVVGADLVLPLVRPDLILDDGTPVYRVDVGARGVLEVSFESSQAE